jgi:CDP-diacylglycerol--serine O-phosphatidyltransferase
MAINGRFDLATVGIFSAMVLDSLDGRVARMTNTQSAFGEQMDSLSDMVSFGAAPALIAYVWTLKELGRWGWIAAFVYCACAALRLARFNCIAAANADKPDKDFSGFPIPAAAGLIASLTLFMLWLQADARTIGPWKNALPPLLIFLSFMMFSHVKYPSFKSVNWRTQRSIPAFLGLIFLLAFTAMNYQWMPAVLFVSFLIYGFVRPFISKTIRKEIEEDGADEPETPVV